MTSLTQAARAIAAEIASSGPVTFARFMEVALYGEGGYYARDEPRIGGRGDFVTGSRLSLFAAATLRQLTQLDQVLGYPADLLEVGVGDARHLFNLAALGRGGLHAHDRIRRPLPESVTWVSDFGSRSVRGLLMSYELFDALPVHRLVRRGDGYRELFVGLGTVGPERPMPPSEPELDWIESDLSDPALARHLADCETEEGQIVDWSPDWPRTAARLAATLDRGLLLAFDYGFPRSRLLDPRVRMHGTVACYRSHTVHRNPLVDVGRQDITAHVDFTAVREAGESAGLTTVGFYRLAEWLTRMGVFEHLQSADAETREQARTLLDPAGMGSEIKVLVQARGELDFSALGLEESPGRLRPSG